MTTTKYKLCLSDISSFAAVLLIQAAESHQGISTPRGSRPLFQVIRPGFRSSSFFEAKYLDNLCFWLFLGIRSPMVSPDWDLRGYLSNLGNHRVVHYIQGVLTDALSIPFSFLFFLKRDSGSQSQTKSEGGWMAQRCRLQTACSRWNTVRLPQPHIEARYGCHAYSLFLFRLYSG